MAPPFDFAGPEGMSMMDPMSYFAMGAMQRSLPRIDPTRYAEGYEVRRSLRGAFIGPGTHPMAQHRMGGMGGQLAQMFSPGPYPDAEQQYSPQAAEALGQYGLSPAQPNPFLFFNDMDSNGQPSWAANHPRTARAIEGAMLGAANTAQGQTIGENISNVARSVLSIPGAYRASYAAQMQAPFDMAHQIAALQTDQSRQQLEMAQAFHLYATGKAALDKPPKFQPFYDPSQGMVGYDPNNNTVTPSTTLGGGPVTSQLVKPAGPQKPQQGVGQVPKGINPGSPAGKAWIRWSKEPNFNGQFPDDWGKRVDAETANTARAGGYGGAAGRDAGGRGQRTDQDTVNMLKDQYDKAVKYSETTIKPTDVRGRKEDGMSNKMAAERAERQAKADAARQRYEGALSIAAGSAPPGTALVTSGVVGNDGTRRTTVVGNSSTDPAGLFKK